jgi:hypothetical protein
MHSDDDLITFFILGFMFLLISLYVFLIMNSSNSTYNLCEALQDSGYSVVYVSDLEECRYINEGEIIPFELVPVEK